MIVIMLVVVGLRCWAGIALYRFSMRAQAVRMASRGRCLYLAIYDEHVSAMSVSNRTAFPFAGQYRSATDFIQSVMSNSGFADVDTFWFLNPGMKRHSSSPDDHAWNPEYSAWCVAVLPDEETVRNRTRPANAPFLFTRNIAFGDPPGPFRPGMTTADMNGLLPDQRPFGRRHGVIVTYGGAVRIIPGSQATPQVLNPGGHALEVLLP